MDKRIKWHVEKRLISELKPYEKNPRIITEQGLKHLKSSFDEIGFAQPININTDNTILSGHARIQQLKLDGESEVDVYVPDRKLTPKQEEAVIVRMNKNTAGQWDFDILANQFELDDLIEWGFAEDELGLPEIEKIDGLTDENSVPDAPVEPVTKRGDIWILGNHRLMCGDSTMIDDVEKLMNGEKADLLHTDPPYNVNYSNSNRPKAGNKDLGYIKNDKMDNDSFYSFLYDAFVCGYQACKQDSMAYVWHASSEHINFTQALIDSGWGYNQQIIWKKPMLLGRGKYQWAHEPCLTAVKGKPWFTDDRTKTTVWDFGGYDKSKNVHPTQKPLFIPEEAINNSTKEGSNVLDLFTGSGSTLLAAEKTNRKCFGMELDEKYCDVIIKRWQEYTGKKAHLESTGQKYDELVKDE